MPPADWWAIVAVYALLISGAGFWLYALGCAAVEVVVWAIKTIKSKQKIGGMQE